ncbi:hypothetical protein [uncultured Azohydromonas sp.]|jgi:hypothetical protein|uniref:hypothetical protein n=1 Tax=uncultured Azohydromonas sp. TaxID=487342 RepID=UPI00260BC6BB|nr:hypothetical protein [uncultured Azohydromonas sp.]
MQQQIEQRLAQLREEFSAGQNVLVEIENRRAEVQQTLLRIGGAIQVLEELLKERQGGAGGAAG